MKVSKSATYEIKGDFYDEVMASNGFDSLLVDKGDSLTIKDNQLITSYNVKTIASKLFARYLGYVTMLEFKYISNGEEAGRCGEFQTENTRSAIGVIVSQDIDVSGGLIVSAKANIIQNPNISRSLIKG